MMDKWAKEPALTIALIQAIIVLVVSLGIPVTAEQKAAIISVVSIFLSVVGGAVVRSQVSPAASAPPSETTGG